MYMYYAFRFVLTFRLHFLIFVSTLTHGFDRSEYLVLILSILAFAMHEVFCFSNSRSVFLKFILKCKFFSLLCIGNCFLVIVICMLHADESNCKSMSLSQILTVAFTGGKLGEDGQVSVLPFDVIFIV